MSNDAILKILDEEFSLVNVVGKPICKIKDEDFKARIKQALEYLDCECYDEKCRVRFRLFASHLLKTFEE